MNLCCSGEGIGDGLSVDAAVGAQVQQESGVVVKPADHFGVGFVGESPVGEVGLPGLVWAFGGEA